MWQESTHLPYSFMTALWMCRSLWMRTGSIRSLVNLNETVTTMYPLVEPALEEVADQIIKTQSVENISYQADNQYTTVMLLNAVENALEKAEVDGTVEE